MKSTSFFNLVAALPAVNAIAFGGPAPTVTLPDQAAGVNPAPTKGPSIQELRVRQNNQGPETCGFVNGVFGSALTCFSQRTCMMYKSGSVAMAGCCDGFSDTQNCGWALSCIGLNEAANCGTNCKSNAFIRKCFEAEAPYCMTFTYPSDRIMDYQCGPQPAGTIYTLLARGTDRVGATTSIALPTLSGNAVVGYQTALSAATVQKAKKIALGAIIGIVLLAIVVIAVIAVGIIFCIKKKKKNQQIANNATIIANNQNRPQSQFHPAPEMNMQQQQQQPLLPHQQAGYIAPMPTQSPQPQGFYQPPPNPEVKYAQPQVYEYPHTPASNPATPAPAYNQPYAPPAAPPPMPQQGAAAAYYQAPAQGAQEVDATAGHRQPQAAPPNHNGAPVFEMGGR